MDYTIKFLSLLLPHYTETGLSSSGMATESKLEETLDIRQSKREVIHRCPTKLSESVNILLPINFHLKLTLALQEYSC